METKMWQDYLEGMFSAGAKESLKKTLDVISPQEGHFLSKIRPFLTDKLINTMIEEFSKKLVIEVIKLYQSKTGDTWPVFVTTNEYEVEDLRK